MINQDSVILAALESLLIIKFRPTFIALTLHEEDGTIEVVISSLQFEGLSVSERVISVFNVIQKDLPQLIESNLVVVQTFNQLEMEQVLDDLFQSEIEEWM